MKEDMEEYRHKMSIARRTQLQAYAILKRAEKAGIPEKYLRIQEDEFCKFLSPDYYKGKDIANKLSAVIYRKANSLLKKSFVLIDGGELQDRKRAGFALLFRMIACDLERTSYEDCNKLTHHLYSSKTLGPDGRQNFADYLKGLDALFISECHEGLFNPHFEAGSFFDEILGYREDYDKPTIISFSQPLVSADMVGAGSKSDMDYGQYLTRLSKSDIKPMKNVLRIKVRGEYER